MRNLAVNIPVTLNINNLTKWQVSQFVDCKDEETPYALIGINVYGAGNLLYGTYALVACELTPSRALMVNPIPSDFGSQLIVGEKLCLNAYTNLTSAYYSGSSGKRGRLDSLEPVLLSTGLLDPALT